MNVGGHMTAITFYRAIEIQEDLEDAAEALDPLAEPELFQLYSETAHDIKELLEEHRKHYGIP